MTISWQNPNGDRKWYIKDPVTGDTSDQSFSSEPECDAEIARRISARAPMLAALQAQVARNISEQKELNKSLPTFGEQGTHTILTNGPAE